MTDPDDSLPFLPYNQPWPSSGHSGSDTSAERASRRDSSGRTARTQSRILSLIASSASRGLTVAEARQAMPDSHHGTISGTLSTLHKAGAITRLSAVRDRCKIYVSPRYVDGRDTEPQGRK